MSETIKSYKGFDKNLQCRGFQYEIGQTYTTDRAVACGAGFHACEYPLDVFGHYHPAGSRFCQVEQAGDISKHGDDTKVASTKIIIGAELDIAGLVKAAISYTTERCLPIDPESPASSTGNYGAASSTGYQGAASSTGDYGAASSTGTRGAASSTGTRGAASSTGNYGAASSTGNYGAASSTGNYGAASSTGYQGAASSTGYYGAASSTGYYGAASSTGTRGAASSTGKHSVAMSAGQFGKASGAEGCALFLVYRNDDGEIVHAKAAIVGRDGIKPDTFYTLNADGEFTEAECLS
jgi:hypothetical protein